MKYDLYVITDVAMAGGLTHAEIAERAIAGGQMLFSYEINCAGPGNSAVSGGQSARLR